MTLDELIVVAQAAKAGKTIERGYIDGKWRPVDLQAEINGYVQYRVKPEPRVVWIPEFPGQVLGACAFGSRECCTGSDVVRAVKFVEALE